MSEYCAAPLNQYRNFSLCLPPTYGLLANLLNLLSHCWLNSSEVTTSLPKRELWVYPHPHPQP